jgi:hypothetical protein
MQYFLLKNYLLFSLPVKIIAVLLRFQINDFFK